MRTCVILNPNSGSFADMHLLTSGLQDQPDVQFCESREAGHVKQLAARAVEDGMERIIVGGGDGTLNEVLNGIAPKFEAVRVALFPLGTGNDFARTIYTTDSKEDILGIILEDKHFPIDVVRMRSPEREHYFLNASGGGFSAELSQHLAESDLKKWLGAFSYMVSGAATLADAEPRHVRIVIDGEEELTLNLFNLVVSNGRFLGGGIQAAPKAFLNDGFMNVLMVPDLPLPRLAALLSQVISGTHPEEEDLIIRLARKVTIQGETPMPFNADGEIMPAANYEFEVMPRKLNFVVDRLSEAVVRG